MEDRLRHAALELFVAKGFEGTTMEAIASNAGVTKRTLYAKYPDKRTLFATVLPWAMARLRWEEPSRDETAGDLRDGLLAVARAAVARILDPEVVQLTRVAMTESHRFPEFARSAHTLSWSPRVRTVVDVLEPHVRTGELEVDDLELAAEQFLGMVTGISSMLASFGVERDPKDEERHIEHAVDLFLRGVLVRHDRY